MTVAQRLQSLSNLLGVPALEHLTKITQTVQVLGETYTIVVEDDDIIIKFEEPIINVNMIEQNALNTTIVESEIEVKLIDDKTDIKIGDGPWQITL